MRKATLTTAAALSAALLAACGGAGDSAGGNLNANAGAAANRRAAAAAATPPATPLPAQHAADDHSATEGARRISVEEARAAADAGKAVFVDVRGDDAYREGHIRGAVSIPEYAVAARASELPKDKLIITYCA